MFNTRFHRFFPSRTPSILSGLLALILALCAAPAAAQTTGQLTGTVRDTSGALIPGAKITVRNVDSKATRGTTSNSSGFFSVNALQPATYDLEISAAGFDRYRISGIQLHPGDELTVETIKMKIGEVSTEITVSATTAGVNLDSPEKSSLITAEDIKRLSTIGRDATELIRFLPGFAVSTGGGLSNSSTNNNSQTVGFGSSSVSSFSANGATPQTGATTVVSDGNSVMDPGDMGASIANVNMDMVQEIKVQTSNFGADSAKGPVVINAVGKSGGSSFHGEAYFYARNGALNANDWLSNYYGVARPNSSYYYPGGNIGGPVEIPGTNFNHSKKLTFFAGFELYKQNVFNSLLQSFVPTTRMLGGDLTPASLAAALNVGASEITTQCPNFYSSGTLSNSGGICYSPGYGNGGSTYTLANCNIVAGVIVANPNNGTNCTPGAMLTPDPHALIYSKFWPAPNRTPQAGHGLLSDGYNYVKSLTATNNGYQVHARVDENFTESSKLYTTYNFETVNSETPIDNTYYAGSDVIPYPTSAFSHTKSNSLSLNFTHVFNASTTNELLAAGTYYYQPNQLANRNLVQDSSTGWTGGRYYNNGNLQLPGLVDYEEGVPDFAMAYFPAGSSYLRKFSYNVADNLSKQIKTHSAKFGAYAEVTANNQVPFSYSQGENSFNHYQNPCAPDAGSGGKATNTSALQENVGNFLQGCSGFTQASGSPPQDLHFKSIDFYATDEWKVTKRITLTMGMRFDHLGPWTDPHGNGLAVWNAPAQHQLLNTVTQDPHTYPGISWHQTNPSIPLSGAPTTFVFYSPRVGIAFDAYGNGKTVFRGGWGAYRFHDSYNDSAGALATVNGVQNYGTPSNLSCDYAQISNTQAALTSVRGGGTLVAGAACLNSASLSNTAPSPFTIYALDPHDSEQPVTYNYNFTVDQALFYNSNLEISYVGNQSAHTFTEGNLSNQNFIPLGGLFQPDPITHQISQPGSTQQVVSDYRPYPNYSSVFVPNHIGYGNYNALQVSWNKQRGAFIYGVNYTWAKALGIRGDYRTGIVGDPSVLRNNYGYLGFNRDQAVNFTYSWQVGNSYHGNHILRAVLNQWEISGITGVQSGPDIAVLNGTANFGLGGGVQYTQPGAATATMLSLNNTNLLGTPDISLQPVVSCDPKSNLHNSALGHQYVNGTCFSLPSFGTNGTFNLPNVEGPAYFNSDLTVQREFKLKDKQNFQIQLTAGNFLNHPLYQFNGGSGAPVALNLNFGDPTGYVATTPQQAFAAAQENSVNFGYTPYKAGYRIVKVGAKYSF